MNRFVKFAITLLATALMSSSALAEINFSDNFESYNAPDNNPIGGGWLWFLTGWNDWNTCQDHWFGYGPNPAPNSNNPYTASNIAMGQSGQALNVFSDYANQDVQASDKCAEVSVFQERTLAADDTGQYTFRFEVEALETLGSGVKTHAFIKLLDPNNGYATVYFDDVSTETGGVKFMSMNIGVQDIGKILQFGFANISNENKVTSRLYDNVTFAPRGSGAYEGDLIGVPIPFWASLSIAGLLAFFGAAHLRSRRRSQ